MGRFYYYYVHIIRNLQIILITKYHFKPINHKIS